MGPIAKFGGDKYTVTYSCPVRSANVLGEIKWQHRQAYRERIRKLTRQALDAYWPLIPLPPWELTVTRHAHQKLDTNENLGWACKSVVDELADFIGINDRDMPVRYKQEILRVKLPPHKTRKRKYDIRISITFEGIPNVPRATAPACLAPATCHDTHHPGEVEVPALLPRVPMGRKTSNRDKPKYQRCGTCGLQIRYHAIPCPVI